MMTSAFASIRKMTSIIISGIIFKIMQSHINKRPSIVVNPYPERDRDLRTVRPCLNSYDVAVKEGRRTIMFSSSIIRSIRVREFNDDYTGGIARCRRFPGANTKRLQRYVIPTLSQELPEVVVIRVGGNDLPTKKNNHTSVEDTAKTIVETVSSVNIIASKIF